MHLTRTRTDELLDRRTNAVARGVGFAHALFAERAEGARLWDVDGRELVDFTGGIGTLNLGHRHPRVVAAIEAQLARFTHTCFQVAMYESYVALAERMNALVPGDFPKKTLLVTTGAEATENAVKIARGATGRPAVIAFTHGYHGRTLLALTMTGKASPYRQNFGPFAPEIYHAPFPDARRGMDTAQALRGLDELFETQIAPDRVAAFIIEPVLGEGGFIPAPFPYLRALRRIASEHGIVLIADEIQTGFGRTGTLFAIEQAEIAADLLVFAKSVAGGVPLAGVTGRADIVDAVEPGGLGGTYAGNPLACAAALATLDALADEHLLARARTLGASVRRRLETLAARHPQIVDVRGLGAMLAIGFADAPDRDGRSLGQRVSAAAFDEGVLTLVAGPKGNAVRFLIPLVATDEDVADGFAALERACDRVLTH